LSSPTLIIATTNPGKFREFRELLGDLPLTLKSLTDFPGAPQVDETGATYAENARLKAEAIAGWSGCAALADDSGLEVDALGGAPGVHSARYAGADQNSHANTVKLLDALRGVPADERSARFRCVAVVALPEGKTLSAEGVCEGRILDAPRGAAGFGYDPVFFFAPAACTFAELPAQEKNRVSHRARACAQLRQRLLAFLRGETSLPDRN
jgi:XTP/dITP diphosphohydrolase